VANGAGAVVAYPLNTAAADSGSGTLPVHIAGPDTLTVYGSLELLITDYDSFTVYSVSATAGAVGINGPTISYTAAATAGVVTLTVVAGGYSRDVLLTVKVALPNLGDPFGGGFYAGTMRLSDGDYLLIAAPKAAEAKLRRKTSDSATSGTGSYHDGVANSNAMNDSAHPAAQYCLGYAGGGFSDWYLPARDEVEVLYRAGKPTTTANSIGSREESGGHGDNANSLPVGPAYTSGAPGRTEYSAFVSDGAAAFATTSYYASSTESAASPGVAWLQTFDSGAQYTGSKTLALWVRPVRRIKI